MPTVGVAPAVRLAGLAVLLTAAVGGTAQIATRLDTVQLAAILLAAGLCALAVVRPLAAAGLLLVPFLLLDEQSPDAVPQLATIANIVFTPAAIIAVGAAALTVYLGHRVPAGGVSLGRLARVYASFSLLLALALATGLYPAGPVVRAIAPALLLLLSAFVAYRVCSECRTESARRRLRWAVNSLGWVLAILGVGRAVGFVGEAVDVSGVPITFYDSAGPFILLFAAASAIAAVRVTPQRSARIFLAASAVTFAVVALGSQRRGVLLGYVLAAILLAGCALAFGKLRTRRVAVVALAGAVLLPGGFFALDAAVPGAGAVLLERTESLAAVNDPTTQTLSSNYRPQESAAVTAAIQREPFVGIGPATPFRSVNAIYVPTDGTYIHNTYLMLPLRYGLLGFLAGGLLVVGSLVVIVRGLRLAEEPQAWALALPLIALLPALASASFLLNTFRWPVLVGLLVGAFDAFARPRESA